MRTALIPPIPELVPFGEGDIHLLLGHLLFDETYSDHYREQGRRRSYLILDNGAHENRTGMSASRLIARAASLKAHEVVAPDVLFQGQETAIRANKALGVWVSTERDLFDIVSPRVMLVPQGADPRDWKTCLTTLVVTYDRFAKRYPTLFGPPVIGISKDYEMWEGGIPKLLEERVIPLGYDIHLLGWGQDLWTLGEIAHRWPQIRSTDSAKPFVYALNNIILDPHKPPPVYPRRPPDYFHQQLTEEQRWIAHQNVKVFRELANDVTR